jgi:hypothetical protein
VRRFATLSRALALLALAATLTTAPALAGSSAIDLGTLKGVTYSPTPSDYSPGMWKYESSDFCTNDFKALWGKNGDGVGRQDLKHISEDLHANFIRLYDWDPANDHGAFLDTAASYGIKVAVPISNWFLQQYQSGNSGKVQGWVDTIVDEAYSHRSGVLMLTVGNEPELNGISAATVAAVMEMIVEEEVKLGVASSNLLAVCAPVSFSVQDDAHGRPAIAELSKIKDAIASNATLSANNFYQDRYVAGVNCFNPGSDLATFSQTFAAAFPGSKFIFTELGRSESDTSNQADFVKGQAQAALAGGPSLGCAIFNYQDQAWKGGSEAHFGLNTVTAGTTQITYSRGTYPLDSFTHKASFDAIAEVYKNH